MGGFAATRRLYEDREAADALILCAPGITFPVHVADIAPGGRSGR